MRDVYRVSIEVCAGSNLGKMVFMKIGGAASNGALMDGAGSQIAGTSSGSK